MQDQRLLEGGRIRSHSIHIDDRRLISVTGVKDVDSFNAVSYTHLTLPTICSV